MNRNMKPSDKEKLFYLKACLLPKVPSKELPPKLICLVTPGILNALVFVLCHIFCLLPLGFCQQVKIT